MQLVLALLIVCVAIPGAVTARNRVDFVLKKAHDVGFTVCDRPISTVFAAVQGETVSVTTQSLNAVGQPHLRLFLFYELDDTVFHHEATFRVSDVGCEWMSTITFVRENSCVAESSKFVGYEEKQKTLGVAIGKSASGSNVNLSRVGEDHCLVRIFQAGID